MISGGEQLCLIFLVLYTVSPGIGIKKIKRASKKNKNSIKKI